MSKILIPLDRSEYSEKILPQIQKFFNPKETELVLFYAAPASKGVDLTVPQRGSPEVVTPRYGTVQLSDDLPHISYTGELEEAQREQAENVLIHIGQPLKNAGYKVSVLVAFGDPADEILHAIEGEGVDMVAMTTHAREGIKKLFLGSVTEKVLHHTSVPLLVMHPS